MNYKQKYLKYKAKYMKLKAEDILTGNRTKHVDALDRYKAKYMKLKNIGQHGGGLDIITIDKDGDKITKKFQYEKIQIYGYNPIHLLSEDGVAKWVLYIDQKVVKNTLTVKKMAELFNLTDVIPNIYPAYKENNQYVVVEYVHFGTSNLEFLNKIKRKTGGLTLYGVSSDLKGEENIKKFLQNCDRLSFQRMILIGLLCGYGDWGSRNIMLYADEGKIKFKLIDFGDIFKYGGDQINHIFSFYDTTDPVYRLVLEMNQKHDEIDDAIKIIKDKYELGAELLNVKYREKYLNVIKYYLDRYADKKDFTMRFKRYLDIFDEYKHYEYLLFPTKYKKEAFEIIKKIFDKYDIMKDGKILIQNINDKLYKDVYQIKYEKDYLGKLLFEEYYNNLTKEYKKQYDLYPDKADTLKWYIESGGMPSDKEIIEIITKIKNTVNNIVKKPEDYDEKMKDIWKYIIYIEDILFHYIEKNDKRRIANITELIEDIYNIK